MQPLERLQVWYQGQCNGDWEHTYGIKIDTLDNPGWTVQISLQETYLEAESFEDVEINRTSNSWIFARVTEKIFKISCGPRNLDEALSIFCNWAESKKDNMLVEKMLPKELIKRSTVRGMEYAWRPEDIPAVIEAARKANLVNIGGQLQLRFPDGGTQEAYWIEVDTYKTVANTLPWNVRVEETAKIALQDFLDLMTKYKAYDENTVRELWGSLADGYNLNECLCFVWYLEAEVSSA